MLCKKRSHDEVERDDDMHDIVNPNVHKVAKSSLSDSPPPASDESQGDGDDEDVEDDRSDTAEESKDSTKEDSDDDSTSSEDDEPDARDEQEDNIINFQPLNKKPDFSLMPASSLSNRLPGFLAQMQAANDRLAADISAGNAADHRMEITSSSDDNDSDLEPHIEMNLGLGVLEEKQEPGNSDDEDEDELDGEEVVKKPPKIEEL